LNCAIDDRSDLDVVEVGWGIPFMGNKIENCTWKMTIQIESVT